MIPKSVLTTMRAGIAAGTLILTAPAWCENAEAPKTTVAPAKPQALTAEQQAELDRLIPLLVSTDQKVREQAFTSIQALGQPALGSLSNVMLNTKTPELRLVLRKLVRSMGGDDCPECGRG